MSTSEIQAQKVLVKAQMKVVIDRLGKVSKTSEEYTLLNEEYDRLRDERIDLTTAYFVALVEERTPELVLA